MDELNAYFDEFMPIRTELDQWFNRADEGLVFSRGKHKGRVLAEVASEERDYLDWMLGAEDMDETVLDAVRAALAEVSTDDPSTAE